MKPSMIVIVIVGTVLVLHTMGSFFGHDPLIAIKGSLNMIAMLLALLVAFQLERGSSWSE